MNKDEYAVHFGHVQLIYMSHGQTFGSEKKDNIFIFGTNNAKPMF